MCVLPESIGREYEEISDERPSRAMGPAHNQTARALTKQCSKNGDQDITGPLAPARAGTQNNPHK